MAVDLSAVVSVSAALSMSKQMANTFFLFDVRKFGSLPRLAITDLLLIMN